VFLSLFYRQVQEARKNHDDDGAKQAINEFDETIDKSVLCLWVFRLSLIFTVMEVVLDSLHSVHFRLYLVATDDSVP